MLLVLCTGLFTSLGVWQVYRLGWKLELIAAVDARAHGAAQAIPAVASWDTIDVDELEYLRVTLSGKFDHDAEVQTLAVTELGSGFWVMTPLQLASTESVSEAGNDSATRAAEIKDAKMQDVPSAAKGSVLVNRGFVPQTLKDPASRSDSPPQGHVTITGLLRASEPDGGFLRGNDPANNRWFSRDVLAIANAQRLPQPVAPFFIDAEGQGSELDEELQIIDGSLATPEDSVIYPRAGMTVIAFRNSHLVYALTWFALALMSGFGIYLVVKEQRRVE